MSTPLEARPDRRKAPRPDRRKAPTDPGELAKLPKKRCKNCPKFFPVTRANREFCSVECKDEFHRHGSAFGPLKERLTRLIETNARQQAGQQLSDLIASPGFRGQVAALGFVHRSQFQKRPPENTSAGLRGSIDTLTRRIDWGEIAIRALDKIVGEIEQRLVTVERRTGGLVTY